MLNRAPDMIDLLGRTFRQLPVLESCDSLLQLLQATGADDDGVAVLWVQRTVVADPAVGQLGARAAHFVGDLLPLGEGGEVGGFAVHSAVHCVGS